MCREKASTPYQCTCGDVDANGCLRGCILMLKFDNRLLLIVANILSNRFGNTQQGFGERLHT